MKLHHKQKTMPRGKAKNKEVRSHKFIGQDEAQPVLDWLNAQGRNLDDPVMVLDEHL